jgi:hypothetical protein
LSLNQPSPPSQLSRLENDSPGESMDLS